VSRAETVLIALGLAVACPLVAGVAGWWGSAAVCLYVAPISERVIQMCALAGLCAGVLADLLFLRRWVAWFYTAGWPCVAGVYLAIFVLGFAFCMGVPLGTFAVGTVGGLYLGRRLRHGGADGAEVRRTLTRGALCAASLTALFTLPIGLLSLGEPLVLRAAAAFGFAEASVRGLPGQALAVAASAILFTLQFWTARAAGLLAFGSLSRSDRALRAGCHADME
jgi:hypothetical protein